LKYADIAMYFAKNNGRDRYQIYTHHLKHPDLDRFAMEARMRKALEQEEFILYYQPQMDMESGHIIGVEALIRWQNPEKGLVYPAEFIQIAEESGLIIPIGRWVLQKACEDMKKWIDSGLPEMVVSVNISLCQFIDNQFVAELKQILLQTELDPKLLCLEITESTAMENQEYSMEICQEIVEMNVRLSIDDFGTGYSSFSLLKYLKFDAIKIDRSFVQGIVMEEDDAEIIHAIIAMAHGLHQKVIAEGVEEKAQWDRLKTMGCDRVQGYYISKPVPESEWLAFVQQKTLV
jgi:EAL domain-containing protein (putative c-di-GMP-specific phosphodiesterase class I)